MKQLYILFFLMTIAITPSIEAQTINKAVVFEDRGGTRFPPNMWAAGQTVRDDEGNYYIIVPDRCYETVIAEEVMDCVVWEGEDGDQNRDQLFLMKFDVDMNLVDYTIIKSHDRFPFRVDMAISDTALYLSFGNPKEPGDPLDSVLIGGVMDSIDRGGVFVFDHDLNYHGQVVRLDKRIQRMSYHAGRLYYIAEFTTALSSKLELDQYDFVVFNEADTLWNHYRERDEFGGSYYVAENTPFLVVYDVLLDSTISYSMMGGLGRDFVRDVEVDQEGGVWCLFHSYTSSWVVLNGVDTARLSDTMRIFDCLIKYDLDGKVQYTQFVPAIVDRMTLDEESSVYIIGRYQGDGWVDVFGDSIELTGGGGKHIVFKFDHEAQFKWHNLVYNDHHWLDINSYTMSVKDDVLSCNFVIRQPDIEINGQHYADSRTANFIIDFHTVTGQISDHVMSFSDKSYYINFIERIDQKRYRLMVQMSRYNDDFFGLDLDPHSYFMEVDLSGVSSVDLHHNLLDHLDFYPNPIANEELFVQGLEAGSYQISLHDALGRQHLSSAIVVTSSIHRLELPSLMPGTYFLTLQGEKLYTATFIKK